MDDGVPFFPLDLSGDQPDPEPVQPVPLVAVYGDSFSLSGPLPWVAGAGWPAQVGRRLRVDVANMAVGGCGWVQCPGRSTITREAVVNPVPGAAVIVFLGSFNDRVQYATNAVGVAVETALVSIRRTNPGAIVIVAGPQWPNAKPDPVMWGHRDEIRAATLAANGRYIDPLEQRWFAGLPHLIWPQDAIHPNDLGHAYLADLLAPHIALALEDHRDAAARP